MNIWECREQDVELLETGQPSPGQTRGHARRFERRQQALSTYLIRLGRQHPHRREPDLVADDAPTLRFTSVTFTPS
jgi:hypothetical protein